MAISDVTKPMALDETLQDTNDLITTQNGKIDTLNTNVGNVAKDTTLQATNTALGLLGKDTSLQAIVTALATIGLNSVGNLASLTTEQKTSLVAAINELNSSKVNTSSVGVTNGVAELDNTGKVPSTQLPSFVDDVLEYASVSAFPATGESGKIYVALDTNKTYRWGGSGYVVISETLALGETSSTAYRGDRGKTAYDHSQDASRVTSATSVGLYKVGATAEGHVSGLTAVEKADITALGIPGQDTTYNDATQSTHGLMSTSDKTKLDGISSNAKKVEASTTNGNIKIDDVETQVYDDTAVQSAISDLGDDVDAIEGELTTDTATVQGNPINFTTKSAQNAKSTILSLEPIQDLHGYSKPWVGGAGKNLLPMTLSVIKAINTGGTWNGNAYSHNNVTFTINTDDSDNIVSISVNSSGATAVTYLQVITYNENFILQNGQYIFSKGDTTSAIACYVGVYNGSSYVRTIVTLTSTESGNFSIDYSDYDRVTTGIYLTNGGTANNVKIYPMIRKSTETDPTFVPYTNICPISGRTEIGILGWGRNMLDEQSAFGSYSTAYTINADHSITSLYGDSRAWVDVPILPNKFKKGTYILSRSTTNGTTAIRTSDDNYGTTLALSSGNTSMTFTLAEDGYIKIKGSYDYTYPLTYTMMIRPSSDTDATFEPYTESNDITINLGQTVYGGTLDVENGVLVVDRKTVTISDFTNFVYQTFNNFKALFVELSNLGITDNSVELEDRHRVKFNEFEQVNTGSAVPFGKASLYDSNGGTLYLWNNDDHFADGTEFKTFMNNNPLEMCYYLATPTTIQLTPNAVSLLKGVNNISTDGDSITLTYRDGSVATLGDLTSAVDELDGKIEDSKILTDTVTGDKYILVVTNGVLGIQQISN